MIRSFVDPHFATPELGRVDNASVLVQVPGPSVPVIIGRRAALPAYRKESPAKPNRVTPRPARRSSGGIASILIRSGDVTRIA